MWVAYLLCFWLVKKKKLVVQYFACKQKRHAVLRYQLKVGKKLFADVQLNASAILHRTSEKPPPHIYR